MQHLAGHASPVSVAGVPTIAGPAPVQLASAPDPTLPVQLEAPRGAVRPGQCLAVRYFAVHGARRALLQCLETAPATGMRDLVLARVLLSPQAVSEREYFRREVKVPVVARRPGAALPLSVLVVDVSPGGVALASPTPLRLAELVTLEAPGPVDTPAEIEVVWDAAARRRYGGRFSEVASGHGFYEAVMAEVLSARARPAAAPSRPEATGARRSGAAWSPARTRGSTAPGCASG